jgi:Uma2 family endonuclease
MATAKAGPSAAPLTREVAELFPAQGEWTEEAYLGLPDTNRLVELAEGKLEMIDMPTDAHQRVVGQLFFLLKLWLQDHRLGYVRVAPLRVRLWPGRFREPDLVLMLAGNAERIGVEYWGVPDLAVEVHSPGTLVLDREVKFAEYAQAGIAEYWMVDVTGQTVEVYTLDGERYRLYGRFARGAQLTSPLLTALSLDVEAVFAEA